jgi:hypothetical protein
VDASSNGAGAFRPRRIGELITAAFDLYGRHWQNLILLVAVVVVPLSLLQTFVSEQLVRSGWTSEAVVNGRPEITTPVAATLVASAVVGLISIVIWTMLLGAITLAAAGTFLGRDLDIGASYRFGLARFWSIVWVGILMGLAIVAGFILLVIPGLFVLTRLSVAVPSLVVEGRRGGSALSRSWNLVRGHGWHVFGTLVVAWILTGLVRSVLTAPFAGWVSQGIASAIASIVTMPFTALVGVMLYLDLRVRAEGLDAPTLERELAAASGR